MTVQPTEQCVQMFLRMVAPDVAIEPAASALRTLASGSAPTRGEPAGGEAGAAQEAAAVEAAAAIGRQTRRRACRGVPGVRFS